MLCIAWTMSHSPFLYQEHSRISFLLSPLLRKLYFVDRRKDVMEVTELDGSFRKTLIYKGLFEPRAVIVDPKHGYFLNVYHFQSGNV